MKYPPCETLLYGHVKLHANTYNTFQYTDPNILTVIQIHRNSVI